MTMMQRVLDVFGKSLIFVVFIAILLIHSICNGQLQQIQILNNADVTSSSVIHVKKTTQNPTIPSYTHINESATVKVVSNLTDNSTLLTQVTETSHRKTEGSTTNTTTLSIKSDQSDFSQHPNVKVRDNATAENASRLSSQNTKESTQETVETVEEQSDRFPSPFDNDEYDQQPDQGSLKNNTRDEPPSWDEQPSNDEDADDEDEDPYYRHTSDNSTEDNNFDSYPDGDVIDFKDFIDEDKQDQLPYWERMKKKIKFPQFYHAQGTLSLPYDGIIEPFEAWYAGKYNMSRIDYYYGMDKTFQRGDLLDNGVLVKVIPVHWGKDSNLDKNEISCWYRPGFKWAPERGQNVVPTNLDDFKFAGEEYRSGMPTLKYVRTMIKFNKNNSYTFYITKEKPHKPLRYIMHGYDTLLHSFYDHYVMDYLTFHPWKYDFDIMKIPKGNYCEKKLSKLKSKFHFNPMLEFMHENFNDVDVEELFDHFKDNHNKSYSDKMEHEKRKHIFRHNMRFIRSKNRAGLNYTLKPNELADVTEEEFETYKGLLIDPSGGDEALKKQVIPEVRFSIPSTPLPKNLDWREYDAVTPAKAQGRCGSCWTFSAMGPIEGAYAIQTGKLVDLSEQQLMDCSWGFGNHGCRGGYSWRALVWARKFGVATSNTYGRYLAQEGYCHCAKEDNCTTINFARMMTVPKMKEDALRRGLAQYGPASVAINVDRKSLKFYSSGIYDDPHCSSRTNHGVVAVGYGEEGDKPYWIIKNSWGKFWGNEGFLKVSRKNNRCGVITNEPIFVKFNTTRKGYLDTQELEFPFLRMQKNIFVDPERELNVSALKLSPFDYKRSDIDFWTPPGFIKEKRKNIS